MNPPAQLSTACRAGVNKEVEYFFKMGLRPKPRPAGPPPAAPFQPVVGFGLVMVGLEMVGLGMRSEIAVFRTAERGPCNFPPFRIILRLENALVLGRATQPLSQLWKVHLAVLESKIGEEIARESLRQQRQDTAHSVRDLYYQIAQTGALIYLAIMGSPFGFMAFLGIASLIGVIVSHVIVLFDFIEEMHEKGEPFEQAIRNAGIERLRPVLTTVCATILALFPLTSHGGPLWKPLCYAQIGGLAVATFITLLLVPVLYSIAVLDLRIVKWETKPKETL